MTSWDKVAEHRSAWRSKASVLGRGPGWSYWLLQGKVPSNKLVLTGAPGAARPER